MKKKLYKYNFTIIKLVVCISAIIYSISNSAKPFESFELEWLLVAIFVFCTTCYEISERKRMLWLCTEGVLTICFFFCRQTEMILYFCVIIVFLDFITYYEKNISYGLLCYSTVVLCNDSRDTLFICCSFLLCIYFQNYRIIKSYHKYIVDSTKEEFNLKEDMNLQKQTYLKEKEKSALYAENRILEERENIFQQLHDHLGHNINGSIYQLEAAKVLYKKNPEESMKITQAVIDNLRSSMDEIRSIFRKEKPSKSKMAIVQLTNLCKECREKYGIEAYLDIEGEENKIPEKVMEAILDNTYEAVTNSLKYSRCTKLSVHIIVLNQFVRCIIEDDGCGCEKIEEGMGIQGMKNRMRVIGGILSIHSEIGFEIDMLFPLQKEKVSTDN